MNSVFHCDVDFCSICNWMQPKLNGPLNYTLSYFMHVHQRLQLLNDELDPLLLSELALLAFLV